MSSKELTVVEKPQESFLAITKPAEVGQMQASMLCWCQGKLAASRNEYDEASEALEQARKHKWAIKRLRNMVNRQRKRVQFYEKVVAALEEGYQLVPTTSDCEVFAVRTPDRDVAYPRRQEEVGRWGRPSLFIGPEILDVGEGEYASGEITTRGPFIRDIGEGKTEKYYVSNDFADVEFPLAAAKPRLMEPTAKAMGHLIFDEIGIVGGARKDPWIVGRIMDPRNKEHHSFMVAWYMDMSVFR